MSLSSAEESVAVALLRRAVQLDSDGRRSEALLAYKEGIHSLMEVIKATSDSRKLAAFRAKVEEYLRRAEQLQKLVDDEKRSGQFHEQFRIASGAVGYSYETIFGRFLDAKVREVFVEDPYIRSHHQVTNFLRFCELLVRKCCNLTSVRLVTTADPSAQTHSEQQAKLAQLTADLSSRKVDLSVEFSETLHDREIRLSNGWVIKMGRGLDLYKPPKSKFAIGCFDMDLRECHESTIDIFHRSSVAKPK